MIFDPQNLYPLIDLSQVPYEEQKAHAAQVDEWLGFDVESVESAIERAQASREMIREQWIGLPPQSLQTPYVELRRMLEEAGRVNSLDHATIVDLGAAYGRLAFVTNAVLPKSNFIGIEISAQRVAEGSRVFKKHGLERAMLLQADILAMDLPHADLFFMYDFGSLRSIQVLLEKLRVRAQEAPIVLVGRGRASRDEIERRYPWLSKMVEPIHQGNFSIYRS